jgi:tRNA pseudouridine55 synthase
VDGILLLDKPEGLSSNQALQRVRRAFGAAKAGHTGSLDPLATGMLPCCLGEATKVAGYLLGARKAYAARVRLGATTTTGDREGEVIERSDVPVLDRATVEAAAARFIGRILQRPPAYSALKRGGVPLYRLARRGETVEVEPRPVEIHSIRVDAVGDGLIDLTVVCGAGTYIRSLAVDLGAALGCGAHLEALRRTWVDPFEGRPMHTLAEVEALAGRGRGAPAEGLVPAVGEDPARGEGDRPMQTAADRSANAAGEEAMPAGSRGAALAAWLLPVADGLALLPCVQLDGASAERFRHGQVMPMGLEAVEALRVEGPGGLLLGIGAVDAEGRLRPRRLIHVG